MPREVPEIDRLIEEGLTLYGQGNLDGALVKWEEALAIDPDNPQANSYVEYVRANYELLANDANGEATSEGAPFGIADDEPEYQIEIQPGEIKASDPEASPPLFMDPLDEGWFIDEETRDQTAYARSQGMLDGASTHDMTLEMEADEPPEREPAPSFDDATREYPPKHQVARAASPDPYGSFEMLSPVPSSEFEPSETPAFGHPNDYQTPPGFGNQITGIKQRDDLGFVQPVAPAASATDLGLPEPRKPATPSRPPQNAPASFEELTLESPTEAPTTKRPPVEPEVSEDAPTIARKQFEEQDQSDDQDLISSLPSPRPAPSVAQIEIDTPLSGSTSPKTGTTRDLPLETRAPAFSTAATRELPPADVKPAMSTSQTQDFDAKTMSRPKTRDFDSKTSERAGLGSLDSTREIPNMAQAALVSAPTRDLGLRDLPQEAMRGESSREGTRADVVLAFDPIDARTSEIIEDVDETAPKDEAREDKTRRRITTLFEKAAQWSSEGDLERAVAAVDLALSEDPSSALAQKLIHRNRETMMTVFQTYLGDLERTPQLAKPLHELANAPISPRAAFLLSRIDGLLSIDEILDVCGMPRLEAYRYLCQLFLRGILR